MIVEPLERQLIIPFIHNVFQTQFTLKNSNPGCAHVRKYIYDKRQSHEIISKTIIEGDILDKIKGVYTVRRNPMYNLRVIRMGDSRYTKAKSSNNLLEVIGESWDGYMSQRSSNIHIYTLPSLNGPFSVTNTYFL